MGVKFTASVAGYVSGIRFYKGAANTGTHTGSLWSSNGTLLARATFTGESASGWQQVNFATPVAVTPGSTYIASYHAPNGHYALNLNYFTSAHSNGPLQALANSQSSNGVYRYSATPGFPDQTWQASNYWVDLAFTTNAPPDTTPPTITDVTPAAATTGVPTSTTVTATFNEALDPTTITNTTFQLRDGTGALVAATVTWDTLTRRATLTPNAALANNTTYTATAKTGITDPAGNHLANDYTWSFTTSGQASDFSLWPGTTQPALAASGDSSAVELGVKFTASVAGYVSGIRFYKGATNTGTHTGSLWSSNGTLLARATFTGESASGWQQVNFATPVAVTPGSTYIASYHAPNGHYALNLNYFTSAHSNGPLQALANSQSSNGVYRYSATPGFPDQTWQASNYWVDLAFTTNAPPDTTPPTITDVTPAAATTGVPTSTTVTATFNEALDPTTITNTTFQLRDGTGALVAATVTWDTLTRRATLTPNAALANNTTYTATANPTGITDPAGNHLANDYTWSFTTKTCPCTMFSTDTSPAILSGPGASVELGVKFQSDVPGTIAGVRFYQGPELASQPVVSLWTVGGSLLGRAVAAESAGPGWRTALFASPVTIASNTVYVASYFSPQGSYAVDLSFFALPFSNAPLRSADASAGGNGIYRYAATPTFPTETLAGQQLLGRRHLQPLVTAAHSGSYCPNG